jgi:hypothetical protein
MSRHVLSLWPNSGASSSTLKPSKISRLAKLPLAQRAIQKADHAALVARGIGP